MPVKHRMGGLERKVVPARSYGDVVPASFLNRGENPLTKCRSNHLGSQTYPEHRSLQPGHLPDRLFLPDKVRVFPGVVHTHLSSENDQTFRSYGRNLVG